MTTAEAAASLGLTPHTVRVQINNGKLRAKKVGRDYNIAPSEVERYRAASLGKRAPSISADLCPECGLPHPGRHFSAIQTGIVVDAPRPSVSFCPAPKPGPRKRARKVSAE